jgi:hypothetical protein
LDQEYIPAESKLRDGKNNKKKNDQGKAFWVTHVEHFERVTVDYDSDDDDP